MCGCAGVRVSVSVRHYLRFSLVILCSSKWITGLLSRQAPKYMGSLDHRNESRNRNKASVPTTEHPAHKYMERRGRMHIKCFSFLLRLESLRMALVWHGLLLLHYLSLLCRFRFFRAVRATVCESEFAWATESSCIFILNGIASAVYLFLFESLVCRVLGPESWVSRECHTQLRIV